MTLAAGTTLGQYEIRLPLGAGGMGEVYRAHDTRLDREVAIKVLPESLTSHPDRLRRFEQEARAAAALNHPNILAVYQMATHEGVSYMVTELLEGETLRERLQRGAIPLRKAIGYAVQIAHGLAAAHEKGIVHRDLKPENLFITKDGRVKILDFGLAKLTRPQTASADGKTVTLPQHTEPGVVMGTVGYMSPEQLRGQAADPRSDIFAFGSIFYEMVTGKPAFRKPTSADTMAAILTGEPQSISQLAPSVPAGLQRVVHRCLEKNAEQRFHSAHDLAFALEALTDSAISSPPADSALPSASSGPPVQAGTAGESSDFATPGVRPLRRPGSRLAWIALAFVVVASLAALAFWWSRPPGPVVIDGINQLTDDGKAKGVHESLQTDGLRLYFNEGRLGTLDIVQMAVTGGPVAVIPTPLADAQPTAITPDGSALLVLQGGAGPPGKPAWRVPLPAGEPIRLGDLKGQDVSVTPDGHILLADGFDLYIAEKDGSNPRKIISSKAGLIGNPSMSPDGRKLVFTIYPAGSPELYEANGDGSEVRFLAKTKEIGGFCCSQWTPDGRYIVFETRALFRQDIWYMRMQRGWLQPANEPQRLTAGPISYNDPIPSRDGKQIFAIGTKQRGEVVRYDFKSKRFIPILAGISATNVSYSSDGNWVAYLSFPDHTAWRSRSDGTDRLQLVFPPVWANEVAISPDGKRVEYVAAGNIYLVGIDGGAPKAVVNDGHSWAADWSPDGNRIAFLNNDAEHSGLFVLDVRTGKKTLVPGSRGVPALWIGDDDLLEPDTSGFRVFDGKTQTWSDWDFEPKFNLITRWGVLADAHYLYLTTGEPEPEVLRIRLGEHKAEKIASLKGFQFAMYTQIHGAGRHVDVAPDGSPVFTRDTGSQEIYALTVEWP
jgi:eukaryotic-like serine/threonine-protein kinase